MKVLIVNSGKSKFVIGENNVEPENLSRDDLLMILNNIYESEENVVIPSIEELDEIRNPIEKEIVQQIIQKISDFSNNVENIRQEVQAQFPVIED
ncbi:TPA: hypothetical protein ACF3XF_001254 [Enterococcus faecium]|jgi:hypothetical protein|uniref:hypothetical protein n=1 Tax=Bacilli TaxID=91061 RepID=UPI000CF188B2|nr:MULTISPECIES: hypothetical protein [Bacilli]EKK7202362.1 hypothetical protein [Listeria innocua]HEN0132828.1 hypothetical protein [Streptococcus agalactiae]EAC4520787.1 hypothetical protein [Listeria monocytogenes]EAE2148949.1 hypothetical protein [Listeria monocytogenes]EDN7983064.1 hypothetical protein [Listeria monocytogenes]